MVLWEVHRSLATVQDPLICKHNEILNFPGALDVIIGEFG